jgi:hypothetical protein
MSTPRIAMRSVTFLAVLMLIASTAKAEPCPPTPADFARWGVLPSDASGDDWLGRRWCGTPTPAGPTGADPAARAAVIASVRANMGLDRSDEWEQFLDQTSSCESNWGLRLMNGGYFGDLVGESRDQDSLRHRLTPLAGIPGRYPVITRWSSQWVNHYTSDIGHDFECGDMPTRTGGWVLNASNPAIGANNLFYPWFWLSAVPSRAGTLIHEAAHEFSNHIGNERCINGGSCDRAFGEANATTFGVTFQMQSVDAYQKAAGRELAVANFGDGTCGYLPLLPQALRRHTIDEALWRMQRAFEVPNDWDTYPAAIRLVNDTRPGRDRTVLVPELDIRNGVQWACDVVCPMADFETGGARYCDEARQPANVERNATNGSRCRAINAEAAAGVSAAELGRLRERVITDMVGCAPGLSQSYLSTVCNTAASGATNVAEIESRWPEFPEDYGYIEAEAIRACQSKFCDRQPKAPWRTAASAACYEWDDSTGCLALACGELADAEAEGGREGVEYLEAVVCRRSELATGGLRLARGVASCQEQHDRCVTVERYGAAWDEYVGGGECWAPAAGVAATDPLFTNAYASIGIGTATNWASVNGVGADYLLSECTVTRLACEAHQAAVLATIAGIVSEHERTRPSDPPPMPRDLESRGVFDRQLVDALIAWRSALDALPASSSISRDSTFLRLAKIPEATVGTAHLAGYGTFVAAGGAHFASEWINPAVITLYRGGGAGPDPYAMPLSEFASDIAALGAMASDLESTATHSALMNAESIGLEAGFEYARALLAARSGSEARAALADLVEAASTMP